MAEPDHGAIIPTARGGAADLNRFYAYFLILCQWGAGY